MFFTTVFIASSLFMAGKKVYSVIKKREKNQHTKQLTGLQKPKDVVNADSALEMVQAEKKLIKI